MPSLSVIKTLAAFASALILFCAVLDRASAQSESVVTSLQCTSNDVRIVGMGEILNEPCSCQPGELFNATVEFTIENNAASDRLCLGIYLCAALNQPFQRLELSPSTAPGKTTNTYMATLLNFPCGSGLTCFGAQGPGELGSVFPKGEACPAGECCDTIIYGTPNSNAPCPDTTPIASKCRHQQICIQGRSAALSCVNNQCTTQCGGNVSLVVCGDGITATPLTFRLSIDGGNTFPITPTSSNDTCAFFTVAGIAGQVTAVARLTDSSSPPCNTLSNQVVLFSSAVNATLAATGFNGCGVGNGTITATAHGFDTTALTYAFSIDGFGVQSGTSNTVIYTPNPDVGCHVVSVTISGGGCAAQAALRISQCVSTTFGCTAG